MITKIALVRNQPEIINTRFTKSVDKITGVYPPLGLEYIAAHLLANGYNVSIIDAQAERLSDLDIIKRVKESGVELVGITAMTPTAKSALKLCLEMKKALPQVKIVMGGVFASTPEFNIAIARFECIDYGVVGEGERTMVELVSALNSKQDLHCVAGLVWRNHSVVEFNAARELDKRWWILPPAREVVARNHYDCVAMQKNMTTITAARGCPYNCSFCYKDVGGRMYRPSPIDRVIAEINNCVTNYGVKYFSFYDDCFPSRKYIVELCDALITSELNRIIKWEGQERADLVDLELLGLMKEAGCTRIKFGVESGNELIRQRMNKNETTAQIKEAFRLCRKVGLETLAFIIVGYPGETDATYQDSINLAKELKPDIVVFTKATPLPNTEMMREFVLYGFDEHYWEKQIFDDNPAASFDINDMRVKQAYREYYLRPQYVIDQLLKIRSMDNIVKDFKGALAVWKG